MKTFFKLTAVVVLTFLVGITGAVAQRVITGTVYRDGKPAAGVEVSAHKSSDSFFTSFDGVYKIEANEKSKYLKFVFPDTEEKLDIEGKTENKFDFYLGEKGAGAVNSNADLRTQGELVKAKVRDYMSNFSMYDQFYKQKDYQSALAPWKVIFSKYPKSSENLYIHGVKIYEKLLEAGGDVTLLDEAMKVYDQRIEFFGEEGYNLGRKATTYLKYKLKNADGLTDDQLKVIYKTGYDWLDSSVQKEGEKTEAAVLVQMMQATSLLFKTGEFDADKVFANYEKATGILEGVLAKDENSESAKVGLSYVNTIFENSGAADCDALNRLYTAKFAADPNNVDMLKKMMRMLNREDCTDSQLYADAAEKLYELDPSAAAARSMARLFLRRGDGAKASEYYEQAINTEQDGEEKATYLYELAQLTYAQKQYPKARKMARRAAELKPNYGKAYILIGKIFAAAAETIGEKDFDHRMVYCLAVDYFAKAKRIDPEVADEANKEIATYRRYFPGKEDAFFQGFAEGASYNVGGWVNETTKVRVR